MPDQARHDAWPPANVILNLIQDPPPDPWMPDQARHDVPGCAYNVIPNLIQDPPPVPVGAGSSPA